MRTVSIPCPKCGAHLTLPKEVHEARCEYCSAAFRVEAPTPPATGRADAGRPKRRGGAVQLLVPLVVLGVVVAGAYVIVNRAVDAGLDRMAGNVAGALNAELAVADVPLEQRAQYMGNRQPMLFDVDADGHEDVIAWVRFNDLPGGPENLRAFAGNTGAVLWTSEDFPATDSYTLRAGLVADRVVAVDSAGLLRAVSAETGQTLWSTPLGERAGAVCRPTGDGVRVHLDDRRAIDVTLATGEVRPAGAVEEDKEPCDGVWTSWPGRTPTNRMGGPPYDRAWPPAIQGMDTRAVFHDVANGRAYAMGTRSPGTPVPTVARFVPSKEETRHRAKVDALWLTAAPRIPPLEAAGSAPQVAWADATRVCVPYDTAGAEGVARLTCLDAETGENQWDVVLEGVRAGSLNALVGTSERLYASHWGGVTVLDAATGRILMQFGES